MLPDDVLLEIFYFCVCVDKKQLTKKQIVAWQSLTHVCRQWRGIVFGSPRRLKLRLLCTPRTPARDMLDTWPALPLLLQAEGSNTSDTNNIIPVLERNVRVCQIKLVGLSSSQFEEVLVEMQKPFPELEHLELWPNDETVLLPSSFLGGFAPSLRFLWLARIPYPNLPKLLRSATHLVDLHLLGVPHSGYFSPDAMLVALSTLTSLESLSLKFQSPLSCPDEADMRHRLPPPWRRVCLPVLTYFWFKGASEYLDDLVAHIDAPRLEYLDICFFNQILFHTPQFARFISRTPTLNVPEKACVSFEHGIARANLSSQTSGYGELILEISCRPSDWQVSSLEQVFNGSLPPFSTLEDLCIFEHPFSQQDWQGEIEDKLWLDLFYPFTNVKNLYLSEVFAPRIGPALRELVGGRMEEVLPALQNIFLEGLQPSGPVQNTIGHFVAARQFTSRPIAVSRWDRRSRC
jgi:F-box-like